MSGVTYKTAKNYGNRFIAISLLGCHPECRRNTTGMVCGGGGGGELLMQMDSEGGGEGG